MLPVLWEVCSPDVGIIVGKEYRNDADDGSSSIAPPDEIAYL
jgi:hypothetical protein